MLPGLVSPLVTDAVDSHFSFVSQRFDSSRHSGTLHPAERRSEIINELHSTFRPDCTFCRITAVTHKHTLSLDLLNLVTHLMQKHRTRPRRVTGMICPLTIFNRRCILAPGLDEELIYIKPPFAKMHLNHLPIGSVCL